MFLYCSRPYWCFFSFSPSERFLYGSQAYWCFLFFFFRKILVPFTCFFSKLFFAFLRIVSCHFYIYETKIYIKKYFMVFFICLKINLTMWVICTPIKNNSRLIIIFPPYIKQDSIVHGQIHVTLILTYLFNNENYNSVS